jgi:putative ABC transport system ATP-binding protein
MSAAPSPVPVVQFRDVARVYRSGDVEVRALAGVSLEIASGDLVAIMGASGSGKSTLMNILGCLDKPTSGDYLLDGVSVAGLDRKALAILRNRKLGFVFQSFNLLARTSALENVELPMLYSEPLIAHRMRRERAAAALARVGLAERTHHHPSQLSGGQQQRVAIARALVNQPELLLADEPTGNLDTRTSMEILELFQELNRAGITIALVTHEPDIAAYCRRIIVMRDGRVTSDSRNAEQRSASADRAALDASDRKDHAA